MAPAKNKSYVSTSGGIKLPGTNGLRKMDVGESLSSWVMSKTEKPHINYDKCKVRLRGGRWRHRRTRAQPRRRALVPRSDALETRPCRPHRTLASRRRDGKK